MKEETEWDFGFSAVSEDELESVQMKKEELGQKQVELSLKSSKIERMILPLVDKLMQDNDKPYIYWPNRVETLTKYRKELVKLLNEQV